MNDYDKKIRDLKKASSLEEDEIFEIDAFMLFKTEDGAELIGCTRELIGDSDIYYAPKILIDEDYDLDNVSKNFEYDTDFCFDVSALSDKKDVTLNDLIENEVLLFSDTANLEENKFMVEKEYVDYYNEDNLDQKKLIDSFEDKRFERIEREEFKLNSVDSASYLRKSYNLPKISDLSKKSEVGLENEIDGMIFIKEGKENAENIELYTYVISTLNGENHYCLNGHVDKDYNFEDFSIKNQTEEEFLEKKVNDYIDMRDLKSLGDMLVINEMDALDLKENLDLKKECIEDFEEKMQIQRENTNEDIIEVRNQGFSL